MANRTINSNLYRDVILSLRGNPGKTQQYVLSLMEQLTDGDVMPVDATNPAILTMESAVVLATATMMDNESKLRQQYPSLALSMDDLYLHMADVDYEAIHTIPAQTSVKLSLDYEEILQKAQYIVAGNGVRKLTVPRYTKITVSGVPLTLMHPVDIRVFPHGGIQVVMDGSQYNPVSRIIDNVIKWDLSVVDGIKLLEMYLPVQQVNITRHEVSVNAMSSFSREYTYTDEYCHCRAFIRKNGAWEEIKVTMSDLVYDRATPTVVTKLLGGSLKVTIPSIYFSNGLINDAVRIDIYTTKGVMSMDLENYNYSNYTHDWAPLDNNEMTIYSSPLNTMSFVSFSSYDTISGGGYAKDLDDLRNQVTSRTASTEKLPITEKQLSKAVYDTGFTLVKNIDHITDRQYLATRYLPTPSDEFLVSSLGITVGMVEYSINKLKEFKTVNANSHRLTILPDTLFELQNGKYSIVDSDYTATLRNKVYNDVHYLANELNTKKYLYTPYYYVLDTKDAEVACRIYDLDNPIVHSRYFHQGNDNIMMDLGIKNYSIRNSPKRNGYILEVELETDDISNALGQDNIRLQMSYLDRAGRFRYYIEGKLVTPIDPNTDRPEDGRYIYSFNIETKYDIDSEDGLIPTPYKAPINLVHEFDIVTLIRNYNPNNTVTKTQIDDIVDLRELKDYDRNDIYFGVSHHKLKIEFGKRLNRLWHKTRTVNDPRQLDFYDEDVPAYYEHDVYELDQNGLVKITYDPVNNNVKTNKLHEKGDLIIDDTGEQVYIHKKGDPKVNEFGAPIYKDNGDGLLRQIDFVLLDAKFSFGNTTNVIEYRKFCERHITRWATRDMHHLYSQLLDRSEVFFYPSISIGDAKILADENIKTNIESAQRIKVFAYLADADFRNNSLRKALTVQIRKIVQQTISRRVVSKDMVLEILRQNLSATVIAFALEGLMNDKYKAATLEDDTMNLTLAVRAEILANNQIDLKNDIEVEFLPHDNLLLIN